MTAGGRDAHKLTKTSERNYSHKSWPYAIVGNWQLTNLIKPRLSASNFVELQRRKHNTGSHRIQTGTEAEILFTSYSTRSTRGQRQTDIRSMWENIPRAFTSVKAAQSSQCYFKNKKCSEICIKIQICIA